MKTNKLLSILPLLLLGYRIWSVLRDPVTRKRVLDTTKKGLGDGIITRPEWEAVGSDLGLFDRRG